MEEAMALVVMTQNYWINKFIMRYDQQWCNLSLDPTDQPFSNNPFSYTSDETNLLLQEMTSLQSNFNIPLCSPVNYAPLILGLWTYKDNKVVLYNTN